MAVRWLGGARQGTSGQRVQHRGRQGLLCPADPTSRSAAGVSLEPIRPGPESLADRHRDGNSYKYLVKHPDGIANPHPHSLRISDTAPQSFPLTFPNSNGNPDYQPDGYLREWRDWAHWDARAWCATGSGSPFDTPERGVDRSVTAHGVNLGTPSPSGMRNTKSSSRTAKRDIR